MQKLLIGLLLTAGCALQAAQAGILEDLLAVPAIQSLLGRSSELPAITRKCEDVQFRMRNNTLCQQARQAELLAKMPPQLRALMAHAPSAQSIRELCVGAIGTPRQGSYLCAELANSDSIFQAQAAAASRGQEQTQEEIWNRQMR